MTKGWVQNLDRDKFEIYVFHLNSTVDRETEAVIAWVAHFDNQTRDITGWVDAIWNATWMSFFIPRSAPTRSR